jgi:hypothetical protein
MSTTTFPNGQQLASSALTPDTFVGILQPLVAQMLGIDPAAEPEKAFTAVRVAWQKEGQPAWNIDEDVCTIHSTPVNEPYSRVRDGQFRPRDAASLTQRMGFTQVWNLHATLRGPNCGDHARLIVSAFSLDWVHDALAQSNLYAIADWQRPVYVPELFQGQWWKRADVDLKFNELVNESLTVPSAAGVDVTLLKETGLSAEIHIGTPQQGN